mmetsp:Transcript_39983/g.48736  ORF Transcript_39983/g.48736 Transcript_39983/m.48736 type:complete len:148 (-) Transcript_39983:302-745(-)|eukprot:CAMPEP_0172495962 /NCGR_PEP_ID=MMETSP1066-20121228/79758_1 /TAXON_ID=671091 /ORGANISM="Coscinodiscus wailesii, Strain CCMP2513" /LENGTH=147 /DNA_ID=CAMNT_0013267993 /DNA_START=96 /DNA_END=539 /DNA_ORIENTATION=-
MSDHTEATANTPAQPKLCRGGCGFFGSNATGDMCSKCWRESNPAPKKSDVQSSPVKSPSEQPTPTTNILSTTEKPTSMELDTEKPSETQESTPVVVTKKKTKKKKASYKSMMAGIRQGKPGDRDIEKEKQDLRKVTGGGTFRKIDKI